MSDNDEILQSDKDDPIDIGEVEGADHYILQAEIEAILKEAEAFRLEKMNEQRSREFLSLTVMLCSVVLGAGAFGWYLLVMGNILFALLCMVVAVIPHFFLSGWVNEPIKTYKKEYKSTFMKRLAKTFGDFQYFQKRGISRKVLAKTAIVPAHDSYKAEDCFYGEKQSIKITLSEARLFAKSGKSALNFDGIFTLFELPHAVFEGHTIITSDPGIAKRMAQKMKVVKTTDPNFGKSFTTLSSSKSQQPDFLKQELFTQLDMIKIQFNNSRISAALFAKKYIFIMIPHDTDMFEASDMYVPVASNDAARSCKNEVEQLFSIMELANIYGSSENAPIPDDRASMTDIDDGQKKALEEKAEEDFKDASDGDPTIQKGQDPSKSQPEE